MKIGKIYMYYGQGKGKTTLAIGQGLRAVSEGRSVVMVQMLDFNKNKDYSYLKNFEPNFRAFKFEKERDGFSPEVKNEIKNEILTAFNFARKIFETGESDMVILDGILDAVSMGFIADDDLVELLKKGGEAEIILTGAEKCEKAAPYTTRIYSINIEK